MAGGGFGTIGNGVGTPRGNPGDAGPLGSTGLYNNGNNGISPSNQFNGNIQPGQDPSKGLLPEYTTPNYQIPGAQIPTQNPKLTDTFNTQNQQAKDYANNLGANSDQLYNSYATQARQQLAGTLGQVKNDYNSRGLLNSGVEAGAEANQIGATNANLDQTRSAINSNLLGNLNTMQGNAATTAGQIGQAGPSIAMPYLSGVASNIGAETANQGLLNSIYGSVGAAAGAAGGAGLAGYMSSANPYGTNNLNLNNPNSTNVVTPDPNPYANPYGYGAAGGQVA